MNTKKIFLLGMPGSGKTTFGKKMAQRLSLPFFDLDQVIEKKVGCTISEIFEKESENTFREYETKFLSETIQNNNNFIMALGGGTPCFNENIKLINQSGLVIFIDVSEKLLIKRLKNDNSRPLINNSSSLQSYVENTLKERIDFYKQAKIHFQPEKENLDDLLPLV